MERRELSLKIKFIECIRLELTLFFRGVSSKILLILWFFILAYFSIIVLTASPIGNALSLSGWVTQLLLLLGIMLGATITSSEHKNSCDELIVGLTHGYINKSLAKYIVIIIVGLFIFFSSGILITILYIYSGSVLAYFLPSYSYILLYWVIPFVIAGSLGCSFAQLIKSKLLYPIVTIVSLVIGPMISMALEATMLSTRTALYEYLVLFNVGPMELNRGMSESFGYMLGSEIWLIRIGQLTAVWLLSAVLILHNENKTKVTVIFRYICAISGVVLCLFCAYRANQVLHIQYEYYQSIEMRDFYSNESQLERSGFYYNETMDSILLPYKIKGYNIKVSNDNMITSETELTVSVEDVCSELIFTLYHDFKVKECYINGKTTPFRQQRDALIIEHPDEITGELAVRVIYQGKPPGNLYKEKSKWVLPAFFAWIPVEYIGDAVNRTDGAYYVKPRYPEGKCDVPILLEYSGENSIICSLDKKEDGVWMGTSSGVTIASGWFSETVYNGITVCHPQIYSQNMELADRLLSKLKTNIPIMTEALNVKSPKFNETKVFIFQSLLFTGHGEWEYFFSDHTIICLNHNLGGSLMKIMDGIPLVNALFQTDRWNYVEENYILLFQHAFLESLYIHNKIITDNPVASVEHLAQSAEEYTLQYEYAELCRNVLDFIRCAEEAAINSFFRDYLMLLNSNEAVDEGAIQQILLKASEGERRNYGN